MTQAEQAIADLDASLAQDGETVTLTALAGAAQIPLSVDCMAFVRRLQRATNDEVADGVPQQRFLVILSPTEITAAGWPGPAVGTVIEDPRIPVHGQHIKIQGRTRLVEDGRGIRMGDELVRIEVNAVG
jgi:hypothetical protein